MNNITVSAPGKLLLMGDHAVVYGYPSIVTAVNQRLSLTMEKTKTGAVEIDAPQSADTRFVTRALAVTERQFGIKNTGLHIRTQSSFSGIYGFGSSSAVTVATVYAFTRLFDVAAPMTRIFETAYNAVFEVQGVGSGFDVAAATFGGTLLYGDGGKIYEDLTAAAEAMEVVVGYSGVKSSTVEMVQSVAAKRAQFPQKVNRIFAAIGTLVGQGHEAIKKQDWESVGKFMDFNQEYLRDLGVSTQKLEQMIAAAKKAGALGAKLSGAGGGDCMVALVTSSSKSAVIRAIGKAGGQVVDVDVNEPGVFESTSDDQREQLIVVDENDAVIGYKSRFECHHDPALIHRTVGVLVFDDQGRILLQKRSDSKDTEGGKWGTSCAGHVTRGREYDAAVHRELVEELGVDMPLEHVVRQIIRSKNETEMSSLYRGVHNGPFRTNTTEIAEVKFFAKRELALLAASGAVDLTAGAKAALQAVGVQV